MIAALTNTPRHAAWGSTTAIARLLGTEPSGGPEAELWFGAHPVSPARFVDPAGIGGATTLAQWAAVQQMPSAAAQDASPADTGALPFLLKVLAAAKPLSLQAHPTAAQAREGFARENAAGVPVDAPERSYRDPHAKPEIIVALSERFDALAGFRPVAESKNVFRELGEPEVAARLDDLPAFVEWLLSRGDGVDALIERVSVHEFADGDTLRLVRALVDDYPGDPGTVLALILNRVSLRRGEALFIPAGTVHAYLEGLGIELMTASDNVLRGGLTEKHVDVPELLAVLDATPGPAPRLEPLVRTRTHSTYRSLDAAPRLDWVTGDATVDVVGAVIALCTEGEFSIAGQRSTATIDRGAAVLVTADEAPLTVTGEGSLFVASAVPGEA